MTATGFGFNTKNAGWMAAAILLFAAWTAGAAPIIRSGAEPDYPPLCFIDEHGAADGFSVELLRETLRAMGREVSFETAPWADLKEKLADGELDVLPLVGRTPEREALYDFTVPYLTLHGALFVNQNETAIESLADLPGKTIAVMKGDNAEEYVLRETLSDKVISTATFEEAFQMLSRGEVDAVIAQKLMGVTLLKNLGTTNVRVTGRPNEEFNQDFCFAVQKGNPALLATLNEGLALTVQDGTQQRLKQKWLGTPFYDIALARPLVYGGDSAFPPYEYLDENGEPAGFNIDIARALARELGVEISFHLEPWSEIRRKMDAGEIDLAAMFYSESRDRTVDFSTPTTASEQAVFARADSPAYSGLDSLRGHRISVQNGDLAHDYLRENGFSNELTVSQTPQGALLLLADGEVDFSLCALLQGLYWIGENGWDHLKEAEHSLFTTDYCFAVPEGQTALLGRINEGLLLLKQSHEYQRIYNRWLGVLGSGMIWEELRLLLFIIGGAMALIAAVILWFFHFLRRQVRKKTAELRTSNQELDEARTAALNMMEDAILAGKKLELTQFALDSSSDTVFWIAPDGYFTFINQAACDQLGYSRDELLSMSVMDIDPDFPPERWPQQWQAMQENRSMRFESHHQRKDGRIFPVEIYASLISRGEKEYIFAFVHDITDRKEQQQALENASCRLKENNRDLQAARQAALNMMQDAVQAREQIAESKENLRITLNSIGDAVISTDIRGRIVSMNPIAESLTGWKEEEAAGRPLDKVFRIINEQSRRTVESPVDNVLRTGQIVGLANHTLLIAKDGKETPIADSGAPIKNTAGETIGVVLVFRDQTKDRAARRKLEESEMRLQRAQKIALVGDWEFNLKTGSVRTSDSAKQIYGLPAHELSIEEVQKLPLPKCRPLLDAALNDLIENGKSYDIEFTIRRPSDQALVEIHSIAEYDPETETVFGVIQDITENKKAEMALAESREELEAMWNTMDVGIVLIDAETHKILRMNPALIKISGYTEDEMLNHVCHDVICPASQNQCPIADLHQTVDHSERELKHKEGHTVPIEKSVTQITLQGRQVYVETIIDITERKRAEKQIEFEQSLFKSFMDTVPAVIYFKDLEGRFIKINKTGVYERREEDVLGKTDFDFSPIEVAQKLRDTELKVIKTEQPIHLEELSASRWYDSTKAPWYDVHGKLSGIFGISWEITDKKNAELALEESRRFLRTILDAIPHPVWWKDNDNRFMGINAKSAQLLALSSIEEIVGKTDYDLFPKEDADHYIADDTEVRESGEPKLGIEEVIIIPGNDLYWQETNKVPLRDHDGNIIGTVGTATDITERKRLQEAIEKRIIALTRPLDSVEQIEVDELFSLPELQKIQDEFSAATGVASIITRPDGTPITQPSNFTDLCIKIIRGTEKGCANCYKSDAALGRVHLSGPIVQPCLSGGLWDAGANISVGGKHIANWLIGQVRDKTQTEEQMLAYAREIGADEDAFMEAFHKVPIMSKEQFAAVAQALYTLANQLSTSAYQNMQQARFIAEEKKANAELMRLSTAIEQSPEMVVITNTQGSIEYVNPAFETTTGYSRDDVIGQNPRILQSGKQSAAFYDEMWKGLKAGTIWKGRIVNKRKDGTLYTEEAVISPVKSPEGTITNYVAVKHDMTAELAQEEQLQNTQKMEAIGQLAGGIAHDFNNILQAILGFSELLMPTVEKEERPRNNVLEIQKAARHAADLTKQLLSFSRKQPIQVTAMNLNAAITGTQQILTSIIGENVRIVTDLDPALNPIMGDEQQISRIIINLAINARDAMPDGGRLTLRTENASFSAEDEKVFPKARAGDFVCLSVNDTGTGMSEQILLHIFEPFFSTKAPGKGTGLGLAAIYGIVQKHNGWIDVASELGKGSTFKIYFPIRTDDKPVENKKINGQTEDVVYGNGERILVVEDEPAIRTLSEKALTSAGYTVKTAASAEEALWIFTQENGAFDLLFSDIILPNKNGADLASSLRKEKPELPIILCSGYLGDRIHNAEIDQKGFFFLEKPVSIVNLLKLVQKVFSSKPQK